MGTPLGRERAVEREETTETDGRDSSITVEAAEEIKIGADTGIIRGQASTMASGEGMGVIAKEMGIHPSSHTPKTDSSAGKAQRGTEVGWRERGLLGEGERDETRWVDGPEKIKRG